MAGKSLPSSTGYFNKEMQAILKKGEAKSSSGKKKSSTSSKKKGK